MAPLFELLGLLAGSTFAGADDMAFVDISPDETINIRSLDVPVPAVRGVDNFFVPDPMNSHDWANVQMVRRALASEVSAANSSVAAARIRTLETALGPLFDVLPKNEFGRLGNGTVRYALHRFFSSEHGWFVKGLEPAGGAWVSSMSITPDVKQVSKYMVPSVLHDLLWPLAGGAGLDLRLLAILAATIEHLVRSERLAFLYWVYRTLDVSTDGVKTEAELDLIFSTYMMVYAFGSNLEVSTMQEMSRARTWLENNHPEWRALMEVIRASRQSAASATSRLTSGVDGVEGLDFKGVERVAESIGREYARWRNNRCVEVKDMLAGMPEMQSGRVPVSSISSLQDSSTRPLFIETGEHLQTLGILNDSIAAVPRLPVSNYVNLKTMCLSTASYYMACCVNECDDVLAKLERHSRAPKATPESVVAVLAEMKLSEPISGSQLSSLKEIASENSGSVPLHGHSFAQWLHRAYPLKCPEPRDVGVSISPMTANEWIADSGSAVDETENLINALADTLAHFTALTKDGGNPRTEARDASEDDRTPDDDIVRLTSPRVVNQSPQFGTFMRICRMALVATSMGGFLFSAVWSALDLHGGRSDKKPVKQMATP